MFKCVFESLLVALKSFLEDFKNFQGRFREFHGIFKNLSLVVTEVFGYVSEVPTGSMGRRDFQ